MAVPSTGVWLQKLRCPSSAAYGIHHILQNVETSIPKRPMLRWLIEPVCRSRSGVRMMPHSAPAPKAAEAEGLAIPISARLPAPKTARAPDPIAC